MIYSDPSRHERRALSTRWRSPWAGLRSTEKVRLCSHTTKITTSSLARSLIISRSTDYARERIVFSRPIGQNQAIQHPLADAYMHLEAAKLATYHAASLYDRSFPDHPKHDPSITSHAVGVACNSAKYLAAEAAFVACERSVMSMGGMGYAAEYHVERYLRECFVPRIAPVSRVSTRIPLLVETQHDTTAWLTFQNRR